MDYLFNKTYDFDNDVYRNIVSLRKSEDLFDDLTDGEKDASEIATATEIRVKNNLPTGMIQHGFHYSTAITYPFETQPSMASRYSDGSFPVWYGSLELETSIYETAYHMMQFELSAGINTIIMRQRAVYKIHCNALLIDFTHKRHSHPQLIADNYDFTQQIGHRLAREGHPGLLAPSARCDGNNVVIFNVNVLNNPRLNCYLNYRFDPAKRSVSVERETGIEMLEVRF